MIEAAWFSGSDLLLYGFKSTKFIVWNETQQCEVMSVECGGVHRTYEYSSNITGGTFAFTKASKLHIHQQSYPSHKIVKPGGHGREIKACTVTSDYRLIATGAEDTCIRLWTFTSTHNKLDKKLECKAVVQKHAAGIQHLQFHGSKYLFSSGGNEEFFVWAINPILGFGIGVVCEASCPNQSEERDLRVMNFDVCGFPSSQREDEENGSQELLVSLAYSDSTIKSYLYSRASGFRLIAKGQYKSSCLLQICHISVSQKQVYLLTAATDGTLVMWNYLLSLNNVNSSNAGPDEMSILSTLKIHQNAIKSLDIKQHDEYIIVATGGDDNALGISTYMRTNLGKDPKSFIVKSAHAAAITGLSFIPTSGITSSNTDGKFRVLTSSNDQRVKEWDVCITYRDENKENGCFAVVNNIANVSTNVADVGNMVFLGQSSNDEWSKKVLVVGNGMEVFTV